MTISVRRVEGLPEIAPGDDLARLLADAIAPMAPAEGDVVVVTQKVVSKAEARIAPAADREAVIAAETKRVVARRGTSSSSRRRTGSSVRTAAWTPPTSPTGC